jgi:hypothetical protein
LAAENPDRTGPPRLSFADSTMRRCDMARALFAGIDAAGRALWVSHGTAFEVLASEIARIIDPHLRGVP